MSKPTIVTFLKSWRGYGVGETAGFEAERAEDLIKSDVAEAYKKGKKSGTGTKSDTSATDKGPSTSPVKDVEESKNTDSDTDTKDEKP